MIDHLKKNIHHFSRNISLWRDVKVKVESKSKSESKKRIVRSAHHGPGDTTQSFRTCFPRGSLCSNWSCLTHRSLCSILSLWEETASKILSNIHQLESDWYSSMQKDIQCSWISEPAAWNPKTKGAELGRVSCFGTEVCYQRQTDLSR